MTDYEGQTKQGIVVMIQVEASRINGKSLEQFGTITFSSDHKFTYQATYPHAFDISLSLEYTLRHSELKFTDLRRNSERLPNAIIEVATCLINQRATDRIWNARESSTNKTVIVELIPEIREFMGIN